MPQLMELSSFQSRSFPISHVYLLFCTQPLQLCPFVSIFCHLLLPTTLLCLACSVFLLFQSYLPYCPPSPLWALSIPFIGPRTVRPCYLPHLPHFKFFLSGSDKKRHTGSMVHAGYSLETTAIEVSRFGLFAGLKQSCAHHSRKGSGGG